MLLRVSPACWRDAHLLADLVQILLSRFDIHKGDEERSAHQRDYSGEDLVIEHLTSNVTFSDDGTGQQEQTALIRIQSEAGVKQFGVLSFPYRDDIEHFEAIEIQVRKPDGRIVATPEIRTRIRPSWNSSESADKTARRSGTILIATSAGPRSRSWWAPMPCAISSAKAKILPA